MKLISQKSISTLYVLLLTFALSQICFAAPRHEVKIPDIPGYKTLKCDFHLHTVFSDGQVWPVLRVEEAWREGLDAIAITDHLEYSPHRTDIRPDVGRSYEIAKPSAIDKGIILIKGAEITKNMPPGHFNAIFIKDAKPLDNNDFNVAIKNAAEQGAFVFWNQPGWKGQQPDGVPKWYAEHTSAYEKELFQGIEVVNGDEYYPLALKWAQEKKLTLMGNSDNHDPISMNYDFCIGQHRPMTLVFAKECSEVSIKEALLARRTAVYFENNIIGDEKYLKPIFDKSVQMLKSEIEFKGKGKASVRITNTSELDFDLIANGSPEHINTPANLKLNKDSTVMLTIENKDKTFSGTENIRVPYKVKNLIIAPDEGLPVEFELKIKFISAEPGKK